MKAIGLEVCPEAIGLNAAETANKSAPKLLGPVALVFCTIKLSLLRRWIHKETCRSQQAAEM
jgi:hypothetical protein